MTLMRPKTLDYSKIYFYLFILLFFSLPLSKALQNLLFFLLLIVWVFEADFKNKWQLLKQSRFLWVFFAYLGFEALSTLWTATQNYPYALHYLSRIGYLLLIPIAITAIKLEDLNRYINAFLYGMLISELLFYGNAFALWSINGATPEHPTPFMQHIQYSIYLAVTALILLNRLFSTFYTQKEKAVLSLFLISVLLNLMLGTGRTGQVGLILSLSYLLYLHFKLSLKSIVLFITASALIIFLALQFSPNFERRVNAAQSDIHKMLNGNLNSSWGLRVAYGITSYNIFSEAPWDKKLFGFGLGDYMQASSNYFNTHQPKYLDQNSTKFITSGHLHSQYNMALIQSGLIGTILLISTLVLYFLLPIQQKLVKDLSLTFILLFAFYMATDVVLAPQFILLLFGLFSAIFIKISLNPSKQINAF